MDENLTANIPHPDPEKNKSPAPTSAEAFPDMPDFARRREEAKAMRRGEIKRPGPGRPAGIPNKATIEGKQFARAIVESQLYRDSLARRIARDELPPQIEVQLQHYAWGKPVDKIAVTEATPKELGLEELTDAELAERATRLAREVLSIGSGEKKDAN